MTTAESIEPEFLCAALQYGCHSLASQDDNFVEEELESQTYMGHIVVLLWVDVQDLLGLWVIPLGLITQEGRCPRLIYDNMWSGLNMAVLHQDPMDSMQFS